MLSVDLSWPSQGDVRTSTKTIDTDNPDKVDMFKAVAGENQKTLKKEKDLLRSLIPWPASILQ